MDYTNWISQTFDKEDTISIFFKNSLHASDVCW